MRRYSGEGTGTPVYQSSRPRFRHAIRAGEHQQLTVRMERDAIVPAATCTGRVHRRRLCSSPKHGESRTVEKVRRAPGKQLAVRAKAHVADHVFGGPGNRFKRYLRPGVRFTDGTVATNPPDLDSVPARGEVLPIVTKGDNPDGISQPDVRQRWLEGILTRSNRRLRGGPFTTSSIFHLYAGRKSRYRRTNRRWQATSHRD